MMRHDRHAPDNGTRTEVGELLAKPVNQLQQGTSRRREARARSPLVGNDRSSGFARSPRLDLLSEVSVTFAWFRWQTRNDQSKDAVPAFAVLAQCARGPALRPRSLARSTVMSHIVGLAVGTTLDAGGGERDAELARGSILGRRWQAQSEPDLEHERPVTTTSYL